MDAALSIHDPHAHERVRQTWGRNGNEVSLCAEVRFDLPRHTTKRHANKNVRLFGARALELEQNIGILRWRRKSPNQLGTAEPVESTAPPSPVIVRYTNPEPASRNAWIESTSREHQGLRYRWMLTCQKEITLSKPVDSCCLTVQEQASESAVEFCNSRLRFDDYIPVVVQIELELAPSRSQVPGLRPNGIKSRRAFNGDQRRLNVAHTKINKAILASIIIEDDGSAELTLKNPPGTFFKS